MCEYTHTDTHTQMHPIITEKYNMYEVKSNSFPPLSPCLFFHYFTVLVSIQHFHTRIVITLKIFNKSDCTMCFVLKLVLICLKIKTKFVHFLFH